LHQPKKETTQEEEDLGKAQALQMPLLMRQARFGSLF